MSYSKLCMSTTHLVNSQQGLKFSRRRKSSIFFEPNAVTSFHLFERIVDVFEVLTVGNDFMNPTLAQIYEIPRRRLLTFVHFKFASHVVIHEVWKLGATFDTPKCTTLPHTPGNQLECCFFSQYSDDSK